VDSSSRKVPNTIRQLTHEKLYQLNTFENVGVKELYDHPDFKDWKVAMDRRYLIKPVSPGDLGTAIESVVGNQAKRKCRPRKPEEHSRSSKSLRVLLAEDNRVNQTLGVRLLEKQGHVVTLAANGMEALEFHNQDSFDVILIDVQMPVIDGFQATAAIRDRELQSKQRIPIVALTAHALQGDRERCLAAGMDEYLTKPLRFEHLQAMLEKIQPAWVPPTVILENSSASNSGENVTRSHWAAGIRPPREFGNTHYSYMLVEDVANGMVPYRDSGFAVS
jgi:CheY-like chemotaxis protein